MVGLLRGCLGGIVALVFSILSGIAIGRGLGWFAGILAGFVILVALGIVVGKLMNSEKGITTADCIIPLVISLISGIVFMPIGLISGNLFSGATCIISGALLCFCLWLRKKGCMAEWSLIMPTLTFIYEILPIDLPTDLDNIIGLAASSGSAYFGYIKSAAAQGIKSLLKDEKESQLLAEDGVPTTNLKQPECKIEDAEVCETPLPDLENERIDTLIVDAKEYLKQRIGDCAGQTISHLTDKVVDGVADQIDAFIDTKTSK